jgi:hypothetical protein
MPHLVSCICRLAEKTEFECSDTNRQRQDEDLGHVGQDTMESLKVRRSFLPDGLSFTFPSLRGYAGLCEALITKTIAVSDYNMKKESLSSVSETSSVPLSGPAGCVREVCTQTGALFCGLHRCAAAACGCFRLTAVRLTSLMTPAITVQGRL